MYFLDRAMYFLASGYGSSRRLRDVNAAVVARRRIHPQF